MMLHQCYYFVIIHPADRIMGVKTQSPAKGQHVRSHGWGVYNKFTAPRLHIPPKVVSENDFNDVM